MPISSEPAALLRVIAWCCFLWFGCHLEDNSFVSAPIKVQEENSKAAQEIELTALGIGHIGSLVVVEGGDVILSHGHAECIVSRLSPRGELRWSMPVHRLNAGCSLIAIDRDGGIYLDNIKLLSNGELAWKSNLQFSRCKDYNNENESVDNPPTAFAISPDGSVLVGLGSLYGFLTPSPVWATLGKVSPRGKFMWCLKMRGGEITALATDSQNNIFVAGFFLKQLELGLDAHANKASLQAPKGADEHTLYLFLAKYSPEGRNLWAIRGPNAGFDENAFGIKSALVSDRSGGVVLVSSLRPESQGTKQRTVYVGRFSETGASLWTSSFLVAPGGVFSPSIVVDNNDHLLVAGTYQLSSRVIDDWSGRLFVVTYDWLGGVTRSALYRYGPRVAPEGVAMGANGSVIGWGTMVDPSAHISSVYYPTIIPVQPSTLP